MADPINLNKARKAKAKRDKAAQAAENRVTFGQSKPEREKRQKEATRIAREFAGKELGGKKRDD